MTARRNARIRVPIQARDIAPGVIAPGGGGGWQTDYEVDFATLATQNLKTGGDGNKTIDGKTWAAAATASASTFDILTGTGLRIIGTASNPRLETSIANLGVAHTFYGPTAIWMRMAMTAAGVAHARQYFFNTGLGTVNYTQGLRAADWRAHDANNVATGRTSAGALSDDVLVMLFPNSRDVEFLSGAWADGWPDVSALNARGCARIVADWNALQLNGGAGNGSLSIGVCAENAASLTLKNLRIQTIG